MKSYEELVQQRREELISINIKDVRKHILNEDYQYKINNFSKKYNIDKEEINKQIQENDIVAAFFSKDPSKQNFTEKLAAELLNTKTLPQSGKSCIRFNENGDIVNKNIGDVSKAADFLINDVYYTQKYTTSSGGAQDNQYKDVLNFLLKGCKKYKVGAILDGDYWKIKRKELEDIFIKNPNVRICAVDELR